VQFPVEVHLLPTFWVANPRIHGGCFGVWGHTSCEALRIQYSVIGIQSSVFRLGGLIALPSNNRQIVQTPLQL